MRCRFEEIGDVPDARGARRVRCVRCGFTLKPTASPVGNCKAPCRALPLWWEWGYWLTLWLGVFGISKAGLNWLRWRMGLLTVCSCDKREAALNTIGERISSLIKLAISRARKP